MERPPLNVSLPSEIFTDFCADLSENGINYTSSNMSSGFRQDDYDFVVNSSQDIKEIIIAIIDSKPFWAMVGSAIWAMTQRHKNKSIYIEKDGVKIKATGMSVEDLTKVISGARDIEISNSEKGID